MSESEKLISDEKLAEKVEHLENIHETAKELLSDETTELAEELIKEQAELKAQEVMDKVERKVESAKETALRKAEVVKEDVEENLKSKVKGNIEDVIFVKNEKKPEESPAAFDIPDMLSGSIGGEDDGADNSPAE